MNRPGFFRTAAFVQPLSTRQIASILITGLLPLIIVVTGLRAQDLPRVDKVELQPLAAQVSRVVEALDYLGAPISSADKDKLRSAAGESDPAKAVGDIQQILDTYCLFDVSINPESRVKVDRGLAKPELVEQGWRSFLVKVRNAAGITAQLKAESPNARPVFGPGRGYTMDPRPKQSVKEDDVRDRWLDLAMFDMPPMRPQLSGLELEYRIIQLYSRDAGKREAKISFNVGQGTQDIGFRNDADVLFTCQQSGDIALRVLDESGKPTTASFLIRDPQGRVYPSRTKRLAPDFGFQPQVYRSDGERIKLPAGDYSVEFTRGPEYLVKTQAIKVSEGRSQTVTFRLERWIDTAKLGWYSGDHHIHAAGCLHYESPTQGVLPQDMIRDVAGEALNVGSVLTWGPCYYYQKQFFEGKTNKLSTSDNLIRYDLEVSGFPSSHCGHLALLGLSDQDYPGTKTIEDWPTWDLPILKWAKAQGAVAGFAHSGFGLEVKTDELPNYDMPKFDGIGADEYIVDVAHDAVDFISTVDTPAVWELNIWYHTLNCGFRTRISGETDFPCISGERVGKGRSYVKLEGKLDYNAWVDGIRQGRSYVGDGRSHLMEFTVNGLAVGTNASQVSLAKAGTVRVAARVAARLEEQPRSVDRRQYWDLELARIKGTREVPVEVIVNGKPVARKNIVADGSIRDLSFDIPMEASGWVAMRIFPSSHTNPVFVVVGGKPVRASRRSAEWCLKAVDQCWSQKAPNISQAQRGEAEKAYEYARQVYRRIIGESESN